MTPRTRPRPISPAPPLGPAAFAPRRKRLLDAIGEGVAVIPSATELHSSRDTEIPYRPSSDLYYLTGFVEPGAVAVLTPHDEAHRFTLFLRPRDTEREAWSGRRMGVEEAAERVGADAAYPIAELAERLPALLKPADRIHYPIGVSPELDRRILAILTASRRSRQRFGVGPIGTADLEASTGPLRMVKEKVEIERMRVAGRVAAAGHIAAMRAARPGVGEWEIQAALEANFRSLSGSPPSFPSIVATGNNATVLHYVANQSRVGEDELVLIDAGAQWGMYCSDITRTFPASGRFTRPQRDLYEVVLAAQEAAIAAAEKGAPNTALHDASLRVLVQGMLDLRILPASDVDEILESGSHKPFTIHQASHWLGLDVHDVGLYGEKGAPVTLEPGMVLTVEPGIYIPASAEKVPRAFRGVGIRIEDDLLVTKTGSELLTRDVPVAIAEIESLLAGE